MKLEIWYLITQFTSYDIYNLDLCYRMIYLQCSWRVILNTSRNKLDFFGCSYESRDTCGRLRVLLSLQLEAVCLTVTLSLIIIIDLILVSLYAWSFFENKGSWKLLFFSFFFFERSEVLEKSPKEFENLEHPIQEIINGSCNAVAVARKDALYD